MPRASLLRPISWRGRDSNPRPLGYEPNEVTELLHRAASDRSFSLRRVDVQALTATVAAQTRAALSFEIARLRREEPEAPRLRAWEMLRRHLHRHAGESCFVAWLASRLAVYVDIPAHPLTDLVACCRAGGCTPPESPV